MVPWPIISEYDPGMCRFGASICYSIVMSKSSTKKRKVSGKFVVSEISVESSQMPYKAGLLRFKYHLAVAVSLITFLVYLKSLKNDFVNWDDPVYVFKNPHIHPINLNFFRWAFFDFYEANWHPLTWISHALDYAIWGLNPLGHHLTNNILHAVNTFVVVVLAIKIAEIWKGRQAHNGLSASLDPLPILIAGGVTGFLFGLHPVHVESVAWVSERKDLLCALFFLLSVVKYMRYAEIAIIDNKPLQVKLASRFLNTQYLLSLLFFALALLSKPMAITLPGVLLILDWHPLGRTQSWKSFWFSLKTKMPFIALSLLSAILTILAQKAGGAMELMRSVPLSTRLLVAVRSLIAYLLEMIWPMNLIAFHPYPKDASLFKADYILAFFLVAGITAACAATVKKQKLFLSVWGYYVLTFFPVLGIIQVGGQSIADRYTYLPGLGPFFMFGIATAWVLTNKHSVMKRGLNRVVLTACVSLLLLVPLAFLTFKQIEIWENSITLWTHAIVKEPGKAAVAYKNRGLSFYEMGQFGKAIEDYNSAIDLDPSYLHAYNNRGLAFSRVGQFDRAIADYDKAIALNSAHYEVYVNRGLAFDETGQLDKAIADYDKAITLNPSDYYVFNFRGIAFDKVGQLDKAIADYNKAVELNPAFYEAYKNRGAAYAKAGQFEKAIADDDRTIALNPTDYDIYESEGVLYGKSGLYNKAIELFDKAIVINPNAFTVYTDRGFTYFLEKQYDKAVADFNRAIELNQNYAPAFFNRGKVYIETNHKELAVSDFRKACALGMEVGCKAL